MALGADEQSYRDIIMFTINQIGPFGNRISWKNDQKQKLIIDHFFNDLPDPFDAIILSGIPEQTNSPNIGTVTKADIQDVNDNRFYFVRIRPIFTTDAIIPNPFFSPNLQQAKRLINMHPLAHIEVNKTVHPPTHGDIYKCRYVKKNRVGFVLLERIRKSGFKIGKVANRNLHKSYNSMSPTIMGDNSPKYNYNNTPLGNGWLPGTTMVPCFGRDVPCSELVNFGRETPVDYFAYTKNPAPSQATDDLFWSKVLTQLGTNSTPNKIRLFNAWGAKESSESTNNPFATSWPGGGRTWSADPNMTAYNWSKPKSSKPEGKAWVRNYSTMDIGAKAVASTIKLNHYKTIRAKLMESNPEFPDSWFKQQVIKKEFETWGGKKADGVGYWKGVMDGYKSGRRRRKPINTNRPGGRAGKCVKK